MDYFKEEVELIKEQGLFRKLKYLSKPQDKNTIIDGKEVFLMASSNYLGLANDERLKRAVKEAVDKYGVGSGGARLTTGSYELNKRLEETIAKFKHSKAAIVYNTGYMANVGTISAICDKDWVIFSDELNHASIIDGCKLSKAKTIVYKHCDPSDLAKKIKEVNPKKALVVSDGVFSMDGDIAPVKELADICEKHPNIYLMIDDAHATGVLGETGSGSAEYFDVEDKVDIKLGTLSKAVGAEGGYVAGSKYLIEFLRNKARSFIFSTAMSPGIVAASIESLEIIKGMNEDRKRLAKNSKYLQKRLRDNGFNVIKSSTPIISLIVGDEKTAIEYSKRLLEVGIYIPAIRPPTVKKGTSRLRIVLMSTHSEQDLKEALEKIIKIGIDLKVNTNKIKY